MNKKLLCTAIGASLALGTGAVSADFDPQHEFALVPYVVKDTNRTTVVTVIMDNDAFTTGSKIHLQYWTKSTTDANTAACLPSSTTVTVTENDILTFDTAGILGYPLFGDTTNPAPLGVSISYAAPRHGYLFIQGPDSFTGFGDGLELSAAYWLELDLANGGAHGDMAPAWGSDNGTRNLSGNTGGDPLSDNFVLQTDTTTSINDATAVNFWPASIASTAFTVTPLGSDMLTNENNQVVMQVFNANAVQGAYDRNENGIDGTVPQTVRCVGRLTAAQLMPGVVANAAWAAQGGWGYLANLGDGDSTSGESQGSSSVGDLDAIVYQVETSNAAGTGRFMSNATRISSDQN